jgi:hypothetical protein
MSFLLFIRLTISLFFLALFPVKMAVAESSYIPRHYAPSVNQTGVLGLNLVPNARMDAVGTTRIGASTDDPYLHTFLGFQLAKPFYVSLRQTAEASGLLTSADNLYPGMDFKLRLWNETATRPAIAFGADSAFGHKRLSSEYFVMSKKFKHLDVSGGVAWGRLGSQGHIKNPLIALGGHFDEDRDFNSNQPHEPQDWFRGEEIGFFGGVEYFTPIKGLSVKADYGAIDYEGASNNIDGFDAPSPWSASLNYQPDFSSYTPLALSAGVVGGEKVMARLSLQHQPQNLPFQSWQNKEAPPIILPRLTAQEELLKEKAALHLRLNAPTPTALQVGHGARKMTAEISAKQETLPVQLTSLGLKGPVLKIVRRDLEKAVVQNTVSPEEIWRDTVIEAPSRENIEAVKLDAGKKYSLKFFLDSKLSLSEEDTGALFRSSLLAQGQYALPFGLNLGAAGRFNLADNLETLNFFRFPTQTPIRSDEDDFTQDLLYPENLYLSWLHTIKPDLHVGLTAGYLEEAFAGYGGEVLYRPSGKTFAVGAEVWNAHKRNPFDASGLKLLDDRHVTGHLNLHYEVPYQFINRDMTASLKVGRYLLGDYGGELNLKTTFENGTTMEGYVTATELRDRNLVGGATHLFGGVRLSVPLGNIPFVPDGSAVRFTTEPIGRDAGQRLNTPLPLYTVTEPFAYRRLSRSWKNLLD